MQKKDIDKMQKQIHMTMSYNMKKKRAVEFINTSFTHTNIYMDSRTDRYIRIHTRYIYSLILINYDIFY